MIGLEDWKIEDWKIEDWKILIPILESNPCLSVVNFLMCNFKKYINVLKTTP